MKHQGYGKVVELPKVNDFMGRRESERRRGEKEERLVKKREKKKRRFYHTLAHEHTPPQYFSNTDTHTHTHSSLLSNCFDRSSRVEIPNVIMKFNYNSSGSGMEISSHVSVPPGGEQHSTAVKSVQDTAGNAQRRHDS